MALAVTTLIAKKKMLLARAGAESVAPITWMAFGDGGVETDGTVISPEEEQLELNHELYRKRITGYEIVSDVWIRYYCELTEEELADCNISELALVDAEGDLVSINNFKTKGKDRDFSFTFKINDKM